MVILANPLNLIFVIFSVLIILCSVLIIFSNNAIHSILALIFIFLFSAALLLTLKLEFLSLLLIIIYVGAIAVLFLFIIMLINIKKTELKFNLIKYLPIGIILFILFYFELYVIISNNYSNFNDSIEFNYWIDIINNYTVFNKLSFIMYNWFFFHFIASALILFVAMIVAILLTFNDNTSNLEDFKLNSADNNIIFWKIK